MKIGIEFKNKRSKNPLWYILPSLEDLADPDQKSLSAKSQVRARIRQNAIIF
jgi:hypothetical protein